MSEATPRRRGIRDRLEGMIRKALLLFSLLVLGVSARAQYSVYATVTVDRLSGIDTSPVLQTLSPPPCTSSVTTGCTSYRPNVNPIGFTGGASYDFKQVGSVLLTADARGVLQTTKQGAQADAEGAGTRIYSGLGGIKATFRTPYHFLNPYVQGSIGYARSNYGVLTNAQVTTSGNAKYPGIPTQNNVEYHGFAGVDLRITPTFDFRVAEFGYGALQELGTFSHTYPILSVSSGIVVHFPPRP